MKDLFKKKLTVRLVINGTVLLVILVATLIVGGDISRRAAAIQADRQNLAARVQAVESLAVLKEDSKRAFGANQILNSVLPKSDALINFSRDLKVLAVNSQVDFGFQFSGSSEVPAGQLSFTNFKISAAGADFRNFLKFLRALEAAPYFIDLVNISATKAAGNFKSELEGRVFSKP